MIKMDSTKVFSVVSLASATTVASFMALMIIRGSMPIMQMVPFIGLNGAIVGGLFYLGVDAMTSFDKDSEPKLVMVRDSRGQVLSIKKEGGSEPFTLFDSEPEIEDEPLIEFELETPLSERLGLSSNQIIEVIKTLLLVTLLLETYLGAAYISNNFTPLMVVTTASMEPTINVGDLIYVKGIAPSDIEVGDIITFVPPRDSIKGTLITHRVIEIRYDTNEIYFKTKGDNNPSMDPWTVTSQDVVGVQTALVPGLGGFFLWIRTPAGIVTLITILAVYMFWPNIKEIIGDVRS